MRIYSLVYSFSCIFTLTLTCTINAARESHRKGPDHELRRSHSSGTSSGQLRDTSNPWKPSRVNSDRSSDQMTRSQSSYSRSSSPSLDISPVQQSSSSSPSSHRSRLSRSDHSSSSSSALSSSYAGHQEDPYMSIGSHGVQNRQDYLKKVGLSNTVAGAGLVIASPVSTINHSAAGVYAGGKVMVQGVTKGITDTCSLLKDGVCLIGKGVKQMYASRTPETAENLAPTLKRKDRSWEYKAGRKHEIIFAKAKHRATKSDRSIKDTFHNRRP